MSAVWSSAKILEFDFAGIEAVLMGWFMRDAAYTRLAKLGVHAYLASHALKRPADLHWPDAQLAQYFKEIKKSSDPVIEATYTRSKRVTHGVNYGLTTYGMCRNYPRIFPTVRSAEVIQDIYFAIAPSIPEFQMCVRHTAYQQSFLGGADPYQYLPEKKLVIGHPYKYKHWFFSVVGYERLTESQRLWRKKRKLPIIDINGIWYGVKLGEDAKRCAAFYPQSTARGVLTEACFPLFDPGDPLADRCYIGDCYYGQTPLRAPIHDSLLLEVPTRMVDRVTERVAYAMQKPIEALPLPEAWGMGSHLTIGVDAKIGPDWGHMTSLPVPSLVDLGVANDVPGTPAEDEDEEAMMDLEVRIEGVA